LKRPAAVQKRLQVDWLLERQISLPLLLQNLGVSPVDQRDLAPAVEYLQQIHQSPLLTWWAVQIQVVYQRPTAELFAVVQKYLLFDLFQLKYKEILNL